MHKLIKYILLTIILISFLTIYSNATKQEENVYHYADIREKKIALTFDDGPHPTQTAEILKTLKEYNIKATFFVIGKNAEVLPDVLKLTAEQGHEIGNHTYNHNYIKSKNKDKIYSEITKTSDVIYQICGYKTCLFRSPGGIVTDELKEVSKKLNYKIILWNVDTKDWTHTSLENIIKNIKNNTKKGSIILFHDYVTKNSPTPDALKKIIPILLDDGYTFCTVSELLDMQDKNTNAR